MKDAALKQKKVLDLSTVCPPQAISRTPLRLQPSSLKIPDAVLPRALRHKKFCAIYNWSSLWIVPWFGTTVLVSSPAIVRTKYYPWDASHAFHWPFYQNNPLWATT